LITGVEVQFHKMYWESVGTKPKHQSHQYENIKSLKTMQ